MLDPLLTFSDALVSRVAGSGIGPVCCHPGGDAQRNATLRHPRVPMTGEQGLPSNAAISAMQFDGPHVQSQSVGCDSDVNIAVSPGGILPAVDGAAASHMRAITGVTLRLLRDGMPPEFPVLVAVRPTA